VFDYTIKKKKSWLESKTKKIKTELSYMGEWFLSDVIFSMEKLLDTLTNGINEFIIYKGRYTKEDINRLISKEFLADLLSFDVKSFANKLNDFAKSTIEDLTNEILENSPIINMNKSLLENFKTKYGIKYKDLENLTNLSGEDLISFFYNNGEKLEKLIEDAVEKGFISKSEADKYEIYVKSYKAWEEYAKSIDKSITDAMKDVLGNYESEIENYQVWLAKYKGDNLKALELQKEYAQKQVDIIEEYLGVSNVTLDNYVELAQKAIKNSPDPKTIQLWTELGKALQQLGEAEQDYQNKLDKTSNSLNKSTEALSNFADKIEEITRRFTLAKDGIISSDLQFQQQLKYYVEDINKYSNILGVNNITLTNFLDKFKEAQNNGLTDKDLENWNKLSDAIINLNNSIKQEVDKNINRYKQALSQFNIKTINNSVELLKAISNATPENVNQILSAIDRLKNEEIKKTKEQFKQRIDQLNQEKDALKDIQDALDDLKQGANRLRSEALSGTIYSRAKYFEYLNRVKFDLINGVNPKNDISALLNYASAYKEYLKNNSKSQQEYLYQVDVIANQIENLADRYDVKTQTDIIESSINEANIDLQQKLDNINATYQKYTELLKTTIENQYENYINSAIEEYEKYLGSDSPIIQELKNIQTAISNIQISQNNNNNPQQGGGSVAIFNYSQPDTSDPLMSQINSVYEQVLGRPADSEGASYWASQIESGAISTSDLATAIANAAVQFDVSSYNGDVSTDVLEYSIQNAENYLKFADGGIITKPTLGLIGEAGYPEAVIPLKDPNDPLALNQVAMEIRSLKEEVRYLRSVTEKYQSEIARNTRPLKNNERFAV